MAASGKLKISGISESGKLMAGVAKIMASMKLSWRLSA
jgi:hypothetical protein